MIWNEEQWLREGHRLLFHPWMIEIPQLGSLVLSKSAQTEEACYAPRQRQILHETLNCSLWVSYKFICDLTLMKRCESVLASFPWGSPFWKREWNSTLEKSQEEISWYPTEWERFFAIEPCPTTEAPILVSVKEQWRSRSPFPSNFPFPHFPQCPSGDWSPRLCP